MTITDFYNFAVLAAKERGYNNPSVTVHALHDKVSVKYICKLWDSVKKKHIDSGLQANPVSAIQSFKDAIDFENIKYSQLSEDLEL